MASPFCMLCGKALYRAFVLDHDDRSSERMFAECPKWERSYRRDHFVVDQAADLSKLSFSRPWLWARLYRAIIQETDKTGRRFSLSGVSLYWNEEHVTVPEDPNLLIMGDSWYIRGKTIKAGVASTRYTTRYPRKRAYAMHERCWVLMTRIVDVELIKTHLDLFVKALCYRRRQKAEDENPLICEETVWMDWKNRYADSYFMSPRRYASAYENQMECSDKAYAGRDPLNVSKLEKLLKHPERIRRHGLQRKKAKMEALKKKKKKKRKEHKQKTPNSRTPAPTRMKPFGIRGILIPPEIIMIIMDMLYDPKSIVLLLWVFPRWRLSIHQGYWRIRCIHDFILHGPLPDAI